jgi:hypothetical protein
MDDDQRAEIVRDAHRLADQAPPLTTEQCLLLVSVFSRYSAEETTNPDTQHFSRDFKKRSPREKTENDPGA